MRTTAEIRANRAYNDGERGFYVVDANGHIAVAGPLRSEQLAARVALAYGPSGFDVYEVLCVGGRSA